MKLRQILRYIGVSDANMEEGNFRCEPNLSLRPARRDRVRLQGRAEEPQQLPRRPARHGVRGRAPGEASSTRAATCPPRRAAGAKRPRRPPASARRSRRTTTATSRSPTCRRSPSPRERVEELRRRLPELPDARRARFMSEYGLTDYEANLLTESRARADFFEAAAGRRSRRRRATSVPGQAGQQLAPRRPRAACSTTPNLDIDDIEGHAGAALAPLVGLLEAGKITGTAAKQVLDEMFETRQRPGGDRRANAASAQHRRQQASSRRGREGHRRQRQGRRRLPGRQGRGAEVPRRPGHEGDPRPRQRRRGAGAAPAPSWTSRCSGWSAGYVQGKGSPIIREAMRSLRNGSFIKWFYLGMHIKRWLLLVLIGVAIMGLGFGYVLREVYVNYTFPSWVYYLTLQFLPRFVRAALFIGVAISIILFGVWKLNTSLLAAFVGRSDERQPRRHDLPLPLPGARPQDRRHRRRHRPARPAARPQGAHEQPHGHRHGRRRRRLLRPSAPRAGRPAARRPAQLHRRAGRGRAADDAASSSTASTKAPASKATASATCSSSRCPASPATSRRRCARPAASSPCAARSCPRRLHHVTVHARTEDDEMISGESNITEHGTRIEEIFLQPANVQANPEAIRAILEADLVVVGPGSLLTSVLPNLLVDGIRQALAISAGHQGLRLQRRHPARRDGRLLGQRPLRDARPARRPRPLRLRPRQRQRRGPAAGGLALAARRQSTAGASTAPASSPRTSSPRRTATTTTPAKLATAIMRLYTGRNQMEAAEELAAARAGPVD